MHISCPDFVLPVLFRFPQSRFPQSRFSSGSRKKLHKGIYGKDLYIRYRMDSSNEIWYSIEYRLLLVRNHISQKVSLGMDIYHTKPVCLNADQTAFQMHSKTL